MIKQIIPDNNFCEEPWEKTFEDLMCGVVWEVRVDVYWEVRQEVWLEVWEELKHD